MQATSKITLLRVIHGLFALYFIACLAVLYYSAATGKFNAYLWISIASLAAEGVAVFMLNNGDCPLIHIQRKLGDEKPFFELFFPKRLAQRAIPFFARLTWLALALLVIRFVLH